MQDLYNFILGLISGIVLAIIGYYFTRKSLKAQQEYGERILKMQLYQEDKKKALIELDELLRKRYKTFPKFKESIESFLDGSSGIFLPDKLRKELKKEIRDIDAFMWEKLEDLYGPPPEYEPDDYEAWTEAYPEQALDEEIRSRLRGLKGSMRSKIKKYVSEE